MEYNVKERVYSFEDVGTVINYALEQQFKKQDTPEDVVSFERRKPYKLEDTCKDIVLTKQDLSKYNNLDKEQKMFLTFLHENQTQDYGTVDIYKKINLSSRKGNKIKEELLKKNLIIIQEQKNNKGWKKIIKLA